MEKMTKKEKYAFIAEFLADNAELVAEAIANHEGLDVEPADFVDFCNDEIAKLDAKAEKAKAKAAEKKAAGDELYAAVVSVLTNEAQSAEAVLEQIEGEDLTVAKIRARLSQAVKNGVAAKETIKVDGKNKVCYTLAE